MTFPKPCCSEQLATMVALLPVKTRLFNLFPKVTLKGKSTEGTSEPNVYPKIIDDSEGLRTIKEKVCLVYSEHFIL